MSIARVHRLIVVAIVAIAAAQAAHAQLPTLDPLQVLGPNSSDFSADPSAPPSPPYFGSGLAVQGNVALAGMPGAFNETGRVAVFVRDTAGTWTRRYTLTAGTAIPGAGFGSHIAIFNKRVLVASRTAVYVFVIELGKFRRVGMLPFGRSVQIRNMDWHSNIAVVGVRDSGGNTAYAFYLNPDGTFRRVARIVAPDALAADRFGERVAVYGSTVAITAPGYNSGQGAAYVFSCNDVQCIERQKLLANDGQPGDDFGRAIDVYGGVLVVGAPNVDYRGGDPNEPPGEQNFRAGGAGYLFVRSGTTWVEQQKLRPGPRQLNWYSTFGYQVLVSINHVLVGAPYQIEEWEPGYVVDYRWSGGSLFTARVLTNKISHGEAMALSNNTLFAGVPNAPPFDGTAAVYDLSAP